MSDTPRHADDTAILSAFAQQRRQGLTRRSALHQALLQLIAAGELPWRTKLPLPCVGGPAGGGARHGGTDLRSAGGGRVHQPNGGARQLCALSLRHVARPRTAGDGDGARGAAGGARAERPRPGAAGGPPYAAHQPPGFADAFAGGSAGVSHRPVAAAGEAGAAAAWRAAVGVCRSARVAGAARGDRALLAAGAGRQGDGGAGDRSDQLSAGAGAVYPGAVRSRRCGVRRRAGLPGAKSWCSRRGCRRGRSASTSRGWMSGS